jgi:glycosyltransferase involved in cell wall biosynthesis
MELVFASRVATRLLREQPEIVIVISPALLSLVPAVLFRRMLGYRVGAVVQDLYGAALAETGLGGGKLARLTAWLERSLLRLTDGTVVIHEVFRQRLLSDGVLAGPVRIIPNWAHVTMSGVDNRNEQRRRLGWGPHDFVALHAGNMGAKQGLEGLVDVGRLAEERGSAVKIVLMGNGSQRAAIAAQAHVADRVSVMDPLPEGEFEAALAAADCLLLHEKPGVVEMSVPSKLTTYFTAGRPVVAATDERSGAAALVDASGAGIRVAAGDSAAILDSIEKIAGDPATAAEMAANGQAFAAEHLTGAASLAAYQDWVRSLIG